MSAGKHSISTSRSICSRTPPCGFTPRASPFSMIGTLTMQLLVHGDALQVDVQQCALDWLMLPVDDHRLGRFAARSHVENGVVTLLRVQDAADLLGIDAPWFAVPSRRHTARRESGRFLRKRRASFLLAGSLPRLGFYVLVSLFCGCCSHNSRVLLQNSLLTEVSS